MTTLDGNPKKQNKYLRVYTYVNNEISGVDTPSLQGLKLHYSPYKCGLTSKEQKAEREN